MSGYSVSGHSFFPFGLCRNKACANFKRQQIKTLNIMSVIVITYHIVLTMINIIELLLPSIDFNILLFITTFLFFSHLLPRITTASDDARTHKETEYNIDHACRRPLAVVRRAHLQY
jgi:hypothetical protein